MLFVAVGLVASLVLLAPLLKTRQLLLAAVLVTLIFGPVRLLSFGEDGDGAYVVGIAPPTPGIYSYTITLTLAALWGVVTRRASNTWVVLLPGSYLVLGLMLAWPATPTVVAGVIHLLTACLGWVTGTSLASMFGLDAGVYVRWLLLGVAFFLAAPTWIQWLQGMGAAGYGDRAGGLFAIPSTVGKLAIVVVALALPLTKRGNSRETSIALAAVLLAASSAFPSLSRANILAMGVTLGVWLILNTTKRNLHKTVLIVVAAGMAFLPFAAAVARRIEIDPEGGDRPELLLAAFRQIPSHLFLGMGPNNYVPTVAPYEYIVAASGYPVHNTFVLAFAEVGVVGIVALIPLIVIVARAAWPFGSRIGSPADSVALLALLLGLSTIGMTGWGLLRHPLPELILMAIAILSTNSLRPIGVGPSWAGEEVSRGGGFESRASSSPYLSASRTALPKR